MRYIVLHVIYSFVWDIQFCMAYIVSHGIHSFVWDVQFCMESIVLHGIHSFAQDTQFCMGYIVLHWIYIFAYYAALVERFLWLRNDFYDGTPRKIFRNVQSPESRLNNSEKNWHLLLRKIYLEENIDIHTHNLFILQMH